MHDSPSTSWRPEVLARKWHALAQRRRNHLKEIYETGTWKRYFTEETLRVRMGEATREVEHWGAMLDHTATPNAGEAADTSPRAA